MIVFKLLYKLFLGIIYCSVFVYYFVLTIFNETFKIQRKTPLPK